MSGVAEVSDKAEVGGNAGVGNARVGGESKVIGGGADAKKVA